MTTILLLLTAACGGGSSPLGDYTLTIYSSRNDALVDPIIQQYAEEKGANVLVRYATTADLVDILTEEEDGTQADVFFVQDPGGFDAMADMLAMLPDDMLEGVPAWARSSEGKWVGLSARARVVVYNTDALEEADLPGDVWGFIEPAWNGRIGLAPTSTSFQTMVTAMRAVWGAEKTRQWLKGLQANNPSYYDDTGVVEAVGKGEVDVGLADHHILYRFLEPDEESFPARNYHPRDGGPGALVTVAGAGVLESSDHGDAAEEFLRYMLSATAQRYFANETHEYPVAAGVEAQPELTPLEEINRPSVSVGDLADLESTQALLRETGMLP